METPANSDRRADFFISYTASDGKWAEWIAWVLEENKFSVKFQAWDFRPGSNFVLEMNKAAADSSHTIAVISPKYLKKSKFGKAEWTAAFANDPEGTERRLIPVRVCDFEVDGLLGPIVYIDLVGKTEALARRCLLDGVREGRAKPAKTPPFPGSSQSRHATQPPEFPGSHASSSEPPVPHHIPTIRRNPSDLDKRRFVQGAFETTAQYFKEAGNELAKQDGVDFDFQAASTTQFTAEIFVDGKSKRRCKIWIQNDGIAFFEGSFGWSSDNTFNEMLSLVQNELALGALMEMSWGDEGKGLNLKQLTPEDAAEYLWRRFVSRLT